MSLRPVSFYLPSSSEIKIFFSKNLAELSVLNFSIETLTGTSSDLTIRSVTVEGNSVLLKTTPQNPRTYYLLNLLSSEEYRFLATDGTFLIDDSVSRKIFFIGSEEFNPVKDRMFANLPKIYNLQGTLVEDILTVHARSIREAQRATGELLSDNFLRVPIEDEIRTRSASNFDLFANENVFKVKRVSTNITGTNVKNETLDYSSSNELLRHSKVSDIISLKEELKFQEITLTKENILAFNLLLKLDFNIIKLLSLKLIKDGELPDCDGNIGTFFDIEKYGYLIKEDRYDGFSRKYLNIEKDEFVIPPFTNISDAAIGDKLQIYYLTKNDSRNILDEFEAYEIINNFTEAVPTNSNSFYLSNFNIVNSEAQTPSLNGVTFLLNENSSETPEEFRFEIKYGTRSPSSPGEYSIDYESGLVTVYGKDGKGTGDLTYICRYNYKRVLEENIDYYLYNQEFVLNKNRSVINDNIFLAFNYEIIFVEGIDYTDMTHKEVYAEKVENRLASSFAVYTKNDPVSAVFRIINKTTGEIYNPLFSIQNKVFFSGFRSPEIRAEDDVSAVFDSSDLELMLETTKIINPAFKGVIKEASNPSNIKINPPIAADLIDTSSSDYYIRDLKQNKDFRVKFFGSGQLITYVGIEGSDLPLSGSSFHLGTKLAIIDLKNSELVSKTGTGIGSLLNSSIESLNVDIFKVEKFFEYSQKAALSAEESNLSLGYLSSLLSNDMLNNFSRIRKVGDYGVDYKNGVIYVAIKNDDDFDNYGFIDYKFNSISSRNQNIITVNDLKITNPITKNNYLYFDNTYTKDSIKVGGLKTSYELSDGTKAFYNNEEKTTNIILDDYTAITTKDVYKINGIYKADDVYGKNLNSISDKIFDISSDTKDSKNLLTSIDVSFEQNSIDFKKKAYQYSYVDGSDIKIKISLTDNTFNLFNITDIKNGKIICDTNLQNIKDEFFYSSISQGSGQFVINIINEEILDRVGSNDYIVDESNNKYNIVSYSKISKTITVNGTGLGSQYFLAVKGSLSVTSTSATITFDNKSDLKQGLQYLVAYTNSLTPEIGTALFVDYSAGTLNYDYSYLYDDIEISYEYGNNALDWSISTSLSEGENYFVSYEYGALRQALTNNFSQLVQLPYFQNFALNKDREVFRDALEGSLQSFAQGPTIPSIKNVVSSISKTEPEVVDRFFGNWVLGRSHLNPDKIKYKGILEFEDCKYSSGLLFEEGINCDVPAQSNISTREGSVSVWIKNKWNGFDNDAVLSVELYNFDKYIFKYDGLEKSNSVQNEIFPLSFINQNGLLDDSKYLRLSNYKDYSDSPSHFGISKVIPNLTALDSADISLKIKNDILETNGMYSNHNKIISAVIYNDGLRSFILENKIKEIGEYTGTVTQNAIKSFELEKKALTTKLLGDRTEVFDIYSNIINIKLSSALDIFSTSEISKLNSPEINVENLFVVDENNYIYKINNFIIDKKKKTVVDGNIEELDLQFIPLNFYEEQNHANVSALTFTNKFKLFCIRPKVIADTKQSSKVYDEIDISGTKDFYRRFLSKYNDFSDLNFKISAKDNSIKTTIDKSTIEMLYSDLYETKDLSLYFSDSDRVTEGYSFPADDIIEIRKKKGLQLISTNSSLRSSFYASKELSISLDRYLTKERVFIGSLGKNPVSSKFKISISDPFIEGLYSSNEDGFYIGISESYFDEKLVPSKHWLAKSQINNKFSLPESITISNGSVITNYKEYIISLDIEGKINVDGELSLVSEI